MREILVIGVGAGDPEQVTMQGVSALNRVDVFFVLDKGEVKQELVDLRSEILRRYATSKDYRVVVGRDPERDRTASAYVEAVDDWRRRRADVCAELIASDNKTFDDVLSIYKRAKEEDLDVARVHSGDPTLYGTLHEQLGLNTGPLEQAAEEIARGVGGLRLVSGADVRAHRDRLAFAVAKFNRSRSPVRPMRNHACA